MEMSLMVSDATGQTTTDDGDSAAAGRARRTGGLPAAAATGAQVAQEASSGAAGAARPAADLPPGCCMCYVSAGREEGVLLGPAASPESAGHADRVTLQPSRLLLSRRCTTRGR